MTICLLTCAYKRPRIFNVFLQNFVYLKKLFRAVVDLKLVVVGDKETDEQNYYLAERYDASIIWVQSENLPLGRKWNSGLSAIKDIEADYIMIMGSDDFIDKKLIERYIQLAKSGVDYVGVIDLYFMNSVNGEMGYWPGYMDARRGETIGCARMIKKEIAEKLDYTLWNDNINRSLDGSLTTRLKGLGVNPITVSCKKDGLCVMDLKSEVNIWPYSSFKKTRVAYGSILQKHFPKEIVHSITRLRK